MSQTKPQSLREEIASYFAGYDIIRQPDLEKADDIISAIEHRLPEKKIPERGLQKDPCDRDGCGMCNRVKGYNTAISEVKEILKGE